MSACEPQWHKDALECPYGTGISFFDITVPFDANGWQIISIGYGFVPWVVCFIILALFLVYRGTREFAIGLLPAIVASINAVLKSIVKQARPTETCLATCGMPSSHSATATALLLYLVLDAAHRIDYPRGDKKQSIFPSGTSVVESCLKFLKGSALLVFGTVSQREFSAYLTIWSLLLLPVPISRAILNDHYPSQILAGCFVGIFACIIYYPLILALRVGFSQYVGRKFWYIFVHNYDVPIGWSEPRPTDDTEEKETNAPLVENEKTSV